MTILESMSKSSLLDPLKSIFKWSVVKGSSSVTAIIYVGNGSE